MAKQLEDLLDEFQHMPQEDGMELVRKVRKNKYFDKPAVAQRKAKESKKRVKKTADKLAALLDAMSPEERARLLNNK